MKGRAVARRLSPSLLRDLWRWMGNAFEGNRRVMAFQPLLRMRPTESMVASIGSTLPMSTQSGPRQLPAQPALVSIDRKNACTPVLIERGSVSRRGVRRCA